MNLDLVPEFPSFRKVELIDRDWIGEVFLEHPAEISERTSASLFIWRGDGRRSGLSQLEGHLLISWERRRFGSVLLEPVGPDPDRVIGVLQEPDMASTNGFAGVFGLVEPLVGRLRSAGMTLESVRDDWDYVYRVSDLAELRGPKYHTQRKEIKKATSQHDISYEPMTAERRQSCLELEEVWCDMKHCTIDKHSSAEDMALREALTHMENLDIFGGVVLVDGNVQALTIGERLNASTAVVHFEKANPSMRGLYQVMNQRFCDQALSDFEFVNREQDVGEPGLRRAKEGYHPHHFVEKHIAMFL